jgi:nitrite reductase/ring-hydroxylating ferredoxin subunit
MIEIEGAGDLKDGEMFALKVGEKDSDKVLVAKYQGKIYSLGNFCTHFGVPLAHSVLFDDKVICPAHNAAFSIINGYPENAPAKNGLPTFEVVEKDGKHFVKLPSNWKESRVIYMAKRDLTNTSKYVIVGGGAAGLAAAETLRQSDYTGEIVILSAEDKLTYDRTLLSKALATGDANKFILRGQEFCDTYDIDFRTSSLVKKVDTEANEVVLSDGTKVSYEKLLIATGGAARKPIVPGIDLENVFTLRNAKDQEAIKAQVGEGKKVVIIGASFIGYECAANLTSTFKDKIDVNVVDFFGTPFERTLGKEVGGVLQTLAEDNGVKFTLNTGMNKIVGVDGKVSIYQRLELLLLHAMYLWLFTYR